MHKGKHHIVRVKRLWQLLKTMEALLAGLAAGVSLWLFTRQLSLAIAGLFVAAGVYLLLVRPWQITNQRTARFLDKHIDQLEFSAGLLLSSPESLSLLARLQQRRVAGILQTVGTSRHLPLRSLGIVMGAGVAFVLLGVVLTSTGERQENPMQEIPVYVSKESGTREIPAITNGFVTIRFPAYTGKAAETIPDLSLDVLEGAELTWHLELSERVDSVILEAESAEDLFFREEAPDEYQVKLRPRGNMVYRLRLVKDTVEAVSDSYYIRLQPDLPPEIQLRDVPSYVELTPDQRSASIHIEATVRDDYGLSDAYVVATVTRGSGESVKFREEILPFNANIRGKLMNLKMNIRPDSLQMLPGDELYYYVEAVDNRQPEPRKARTETYFVVIADTLRQTFMTGGAMAVDLMPDYFRSQRQIILDTEALLAAKDTIERQHFRQESNSLGYDQKLLRIKYGQYLGDEFESGITGPAETPEEAPQEDDPTAAYTHDHDHETEETAILPETDHDKEDPLEAFIHDHSDPEEATLYTQGVRAMLKQAMAEMWDAELYLRLYDPEKSLPYQYKALDLIQKIKNQARIYVHRIGFDPPPIREDARLTGDLDEVSPARRTESIKQSDAYEPIRHAIDFLIDRDADQTMDIHAQRILQEAADKVASLAVEQPGSHLKTLTRLRRILQAETIGKETASSLVRELAGMLPPGEVLPGSVQQSTWTAMDSIFEIKTREGPGE